MGHKDPTRDGGPQGRQPFPRLDRGSQSCKWKGCFRRYRNIDICYLSPSTSTQLRHAPVPSTSASSYRTTTISGSRWSWLRCIAHRVTIGAKSVPPNPEVLRCHEFLRPV